MKYLIILLFPVISSAQKMAPGLWQSEAKFKLNGISMPKTQDENCITPGEVKDPKKSIEESLKRNNCFLTNWKMQKSKVSGVVNCQNETFDAAGTIAGTFDKKNYNLVGDIKGKHKFLGKARVDVVLKGNWTGECVATE